ncbi:MAG: DUF3072 domain-containing protein [Xanthobacteraceae bacterium]
MGQAKAANITEFYNGADDQPGTDDDPMTDEQADMLKKLCEEANEPQEFDGELTQAGAREFIKEMRRRISQSNSH